MNEKKTLGDQGEDIAAFFLEQHGYEIIERNWRFQQAEIDIICKQNDTFVFVEVKTRKGTQFGHPEQAVTKKKQQTMARAANEFIYQHNHDGPIRYDILSILLPNKEQPQILHLEDAFFPIIN